MSARITGPDKVTFEMTLKEYFLFIKILKQAIDMLKIEKDWCDCCERHHK